MKIYCCQIDIVWEDKEANFKKVKALLAANRPEPGSLVVLPEMFATGFSMNVAGIAEEKPSPSAVYLAGLARDFEVFVVGGVVTKGQGALGRNQALAFSPAGTELVRYTKIQPFTLGGEMDHYEPGRTVLTFEWSSFRVAPFICYDLRFPEVFRVAAGRGAQVFLDIANWPVKRIQHWVTLLQARAIENQAYVAGVNRCGEDPSLSYPGRSLIVGPSGEILADAGNKEAIIAADLDLEALLSLREGLPFLKDMRNDYHRLD
jgi:omega-amidase